MRDGLNELVPGADSLATGLRQGQVRLNPLRVPAARPRTSATSTTRSSADRAGPADPAVRRVAQPRGVGARRA